MRFSRRLAEQLEPSALSRRLARARAAGAVRCDLTSSSPSATGIAYPEELLEALRASSSARYTPAPLGSLEARRAVAALHEGVSPEDVVLTASTSESYGYLFKLFCDPGCSALAPEPSYPLLSHLARLDAVTLEPYELMYDGAWHLSTAPLAPSPNARLVIAVSPNNPTGSCLSRAELTRLSALGLPLVSDEVFHAYPFTDEALPSLLDLDLEVPCFTLGGLSKQVGLPGLKVGWMILSGPQKYREEIRQRLALIADTYLSVNAPAEAALPQVLHHGARVAAAIRARVRQNLRALDQALAGSSMTRLTASGGWSACVRLPATREEEAWALTLLEAGVVSQPAYLYDLPGPTLVLSLITPPDVWAEGLEVLRQVVSDSS
ncbi:MAG: pyridoxal phosphate-dependent aminotransferase [Polyangiaceae bacterium]|nr:pyridoxal phosphate-dependent aminotransferase [Polyangiaceae bacterium]MCW5789741.1 pyridoxal phosphate-dependent aminotransferase [Polyangiaceae bacterium]